MAVDAAAQYDAALQAYLDNAGYEANGSVSEARLFITACTKLIALTPTMHASRESTTQMKVDELRQQQEYARNWLSANAEPASSTANPPLTRADFRNFRD